MCMHGAHVRACHAHTWRISSRWAEGVANASSSRATLCIWVAPEKACIERSTCRRAETGGQGERRAEKGREGERRERRRAETACIERGTSAWRRMACAGSLVETESTCPLAHSIHGCAIASVALRRRRGSETSRACTKATACSERCRHVDEP